MAAADVAAVAAVAVTNSDKVISAFAISHPEYNINNSHFIEHPCFCLGAPLVLLQTHYSRSVKSASSSSSGGGYDGGGSGGGVGAGRHS